MSEHGRSSLFDSTSRLAGEKMARGWSKRRLRILQLLREHGPMAIFEIAALLGCFDHQISGRFGEMERDGLIEKTGQRRKKPETGCEAEVYRLRDAGEDAAPREMRGAVIADKLGYPRTLLMGDDGTFERGDVFDEEQLPGVPYFRQTTAGGVRSHWRLVLIECDHCGKPLKCVEEAQGGQAGRPSKTYRCGTPGCNRVYHLQLVKEAGGVLMLALVMKHL